MAEKCQCGCGRAPSLINTTNPTQNRIKGERSRFCHGHGRTLPTITEAFWKRAVKGLHPDDCWKWDGCAPGFGYGMFRHRSHLYRAHVVSYQLHIGPVPEGVFVLHKCDNPPCTNPRHLFLGDHKINSDDMDAKGRRVNTPQRGEKHKLSKLTDEQVIEIRASYVPWKMTQDQLAARFGVNRSIISRIISRKKWNHI